METSKIWNGFEIRKGEINTIAGLVPYICYNPRSSNKTVNIAIHGEGQKKEDWLCFNSTLKQGNLLKASIKQNSTFIAFDLYGHGDWKIKDKHFNTTNLALKDQEILIEKSVLGIQEAISIILTNEGLSKNPITITSFSLGCSISLGIKFDSENLKSVLISPFNTSIKSNCQNYLVIRGKNDTQINENDFNSLINKLPKNTILKELVSEHEISKSWISIVKEFIYN